MRRDAGDLIGYLKVARDLTARRKAKRGVAGGGEDARKHHRLRGDPALTPMALIDAIPRIRGRPGRPRRRPEQIYAHRAYDHDKYRKLVRGKGTTPHIARRGQPHGCGSGTHRSVAKQTIALLH
jgi:hypothetical protein